VNISINGAGLSSNQKLGYGAIFLGTTFTGFLMGDRIMGSLGATLGTLAGGVFGLYFATNYYKP